MEFVYIVLLIYLLYMIRAVRNEILPVVIIRKSDDGDIILQNLSFAHVSNLIVLNRKNECGNESGWQDPVRIDCLHRGEICKIDWIEQIEGMDIGLMFHTSEGKSYYSTYIDGVVSIRRGRLVKDLKPEEIARPILRSE